MTVYSAVLLSNELEGGEGGGDPFTGDCLQRCAAFNRVGGQIGRMEVTVYSTVLLSTELGDKSGESIHLRHSYTIYCIEYGDGQVYSA